METKDYGAPLNALADRLEAFAKVARLAAERANEFGPSHDPEAVAGFDAQVAQTSTIIGAAERLFLADNIRQMKELDFLALVANSTGHLDNATPFIITRTNCGCVACTARRASEKRLAEPVS